MVAVLLCGGVVIKLLYYAYTMASSVCGQCVATCILLSQYVRAHLGHCVRSCAFGLHCGCLVVQLVP